MKKYFIGVILSVSILLPTIVLGQDYALQIRMHFVQATQQLVFDTVELFPGAAPLHVDQPTDGYTLKIIDAQGGDLYITKFTVPTFIPDAPASTNLQNIPISLIVPYLPRSAQSVVLNEKNNIVITRSIPSEEVLAENFVKEQNAPKIKLEVKKEIDIPKQEKISSSLPFSFESSSRPLLVTLFIGMFILGIIVIILTIWYVKFRQRP